MTQEFDNQEEFRDTLGFSENMWDDFHAGDDFRIPARRPPVSKQLENIMLMNQGDVDSNFIQNTGAGGTSYRVTPTSDLPIEAFEAEYFKKFMGESNPLKLAQWLKTGMDAETRKKTQPLWSYLSKQRGLLGSYYVTIQPFSDCRIAANFFSENCPDARFIKKAEKCHGCVYNKGKTCSLMSRYLVDEVPYTPQIASVILGKAVKEGKLPVEAAKKIAQLKNPKAIIQTTNRTVSDIAAKIQEKKEASLYNRFKESSQPMDGDNVSQEELEAIRPLVAKLVKNGTNYNSLVNKIGRYVGTSTIKKMVLEVIPEIRPLNIAKFADCGDFLQGRVSLIQKDIKCQDCVFNEQTRCGKLRVSFINNRREDSVALKLASLLEESKIKNEGYMLNFIAKCMDSTISLVQMKQAFKDRVDGPQLQDYLNKAAAMTTKLYAPGFSNCAGEFYKYAKTLYRGENCNTCFYNSGQGCGKLAKPFSNPDQLPATGAAPYVSDLIRPSDIKVERPLTSEAKVIIQMVEGGLSSKDINSKLAASGINTQIIKSAMKEAVTKIGSLAAPTWSDCRPDNAYSYASSLVKVSTCDTCAENQGHRCAKLKMNFSNLNSTSSLKVSEDLVNHGDYDMSFFNHEGGKPQMKVSDIEIDYNE